jgi:hypothetical protein
MLCLTVRRFVPFLLIALAAILQVANAKQSTTSLSPTSSSISLNATSINATSINATATYAVNVTATHTVELTKTLTHDVSTTVIVVAGSLNEEPSPSKGYPGWVLPVVCGVVAAICMGFAFLFCCRDKINREAIAIALGQVDEEAPKPLEPPPPYRP